MAFLASKLCKIQFRQASTLDPAGEAYNASPDPLVAGEEKLPPHSLPPSTPPLRLRRLAVDAFGVEPSAPTAPRLYPPFRISGYATAGGSLPRKHSPDGAIKAR